MRTKLEAEKIIKRFFIGKSIDDLSDYEICDIASFLWINASNVLDYGTAEDITDLIDKTKSAIKKDSDINICRILNEGVYDEEPNITRKFIIEVVCTS